MPDLTFRLIIENGTAKATLTDTGNAAKKTKDEVEKPVTMKIQAEKALATIRDLKIAFDGVSQIIGSITGKINELLDKAGYQERAEKKVAQAVQQTGEAAGFSAQQLYDMASQLQEVTNFGDEDTLNKVISQLLTFTNITGEQFKGAVVAAQNLATMLDGDLQSAAIQLGKALNDPTEGLTALTRSGVSFSQAEQDLIKSMWETGQKAEAQQKILEAINAQYGGQAEAVANLRTQVRNLHGDVEESLGSMLKTLIAPILNTLKELYEWFLKLTPTQRSWVAGAAAIIPTMTTAAAAITITRTAVLALTAAMKANPVGKVIAIVSLVITAILTAVSALGGWTNAWALFKEASVAVLTIVWDYLKAFGNFVVNFGEGLGKILTEPFQIMYRTAIDIFSKMASIMKKLVTGDFSGVWDEIRSGITQGFDDAVKSTSKSFTQAFDAFDGAGTRAKAIWDHVGSAAKQAAAEVKSASEDTKSGGKANGESAGGTGDSSEDDTEEKRAQRIELYYNTLKFAAAGYYDYMLAQYAADRDAFAALTGDKEKAETEYNYKVAQLDKEREEYAQQAVAAQQQAAAEEQRIAEENAQKQAELERQEQQRQEEIANTRREFDERSLELLGNVYRASLDAIDDYYDKRRSKLIEAGYAEQQITAQEEMAKEQLRQEYQKKALNSISNSLGTLGNSVKSFGKSGFAAWKALSIAQATVDTYSGATAAYKSLAGIPVVGVPLAIAAAAAAIASGLANVNAITKTGYKAAKGGLTGMIIGRSHAQGGTLIEAEGDEYIVAKDRVRLIGQRVLDFLNFGPAHQVSLAMSGLPQMTVPSVSGSYFASGGSVSGNDLISSLLDAVLGIRDNMQTRTSFQIAVDPLSADPVRVSEIADKGKKMRSEI